MSSDYKSNDKDNANITTGYVYFVFIITYIINIKSCNNHFRKSLNVNRKNKKKTEKRLNRIIEL